MRETLKMMRCAVLGYEHTVSINELLQEYKEKQSPNILAYLYVSNYGLFEQAAKTYKLLDTQDIASYGLQELDNAIKQYDFNSNCKFITFFVACLKNRLRTEQSRLFNNMRRANYYTEDISILNDLESDFEFDDFDVDELPLNDQEKRHVQLIIDGYSSAEIARMFNISKTAICKRNAKISKKLSI